MAKPKKEWSLRTYEAKTANPLSNIYETLISFPIISLWSGSMVFMFRWVPALWRVDAAAYDSQHEKYHDEFLMFPIYSLHQKRRPCIKGDLITVGNTFSHIRARHERLADNLDVIIHANCIEEDDDPKYLVPYVGPIVESMVKATNGGDSQAGKVITQSICQQIIYRLAGSLGLNIAAKNAYESSENKSSIIAKIIFNEFKNRLMV